MSVTSAFFNPWSFWTSALTRPAPSKPAAPIDIKLGRGDPGIKLSKSGNTVTLKGRAAGPIDREFYLISRAVSFQLDMGTKPDFSKERYATKSNQWYFAHTTSWDTNEGQSAARIAQGLADKLNEAGAYRAVVKVKSPTEATITLVRT